MANLNGTSAADTLNASSGDDTLNGDAGDDIISVGGGDDLVGGGLGNDTFNITLPTAASDDDLHIDGDSHVTAADTWTDPAGTAGTADKIVISGELTNAFDFIEWNGDTTDDTTGTDANSEGEIAANGYLLAFNGAGTVNDFAVDFKNIEEVVFDNVTIDLDAGDTSLFTSTITYTSTDGGVINGGAAAKVDGNVGEINVNAAADGDKISVKDDDDWEITHVNGTKVADLTNSTYTATGNYTVVVSSSGDGRDNDQILVTHVAGGTDTLKKSTDTIELTMKNDDGDVVTQKVLVVDSSSFDGTGDITGNSGDDTINATGDNDQELDGGKGNDLINAGFGDDTLTGGSGNDTLNGGGDDGGTGDWVDYTSSVTAITTTSVTADAEGTDTVSGIETISAQNLGDTLGDIAGLNAGDAAITAGTGLAVGTDGVFGTHQSVAIDGGSSVDISLGGNLVNYKSGATKAFTSSELDGWKVTGYMVLSDGDSETVPAVGKEIDIPDVGVLTVQSTDLDDTVQFEFSAKESLVEEAAQTDTVVIIVKNSDETETRHIVLDLKLNGEADSKTGTDGADSFSTGVGDDAVSAGEGNDSLDGGEGDDTLNGEEGDDNILGGEGDDEINGGDGNDTGNGGDGNDEINGGAGNDAFYAGADDDGNDDMDGGAGDDTLGGGAGDDTITGGEGSNLIFGGDDDDTITLSSGDDSLQGDSTGWAGSGDDSINGGDKNDQIGGGDDDDTVEGNDGNDTIFGGKSGRDDLEGDDGDDLIFAGTDRDTLNGGDGDDTLFGGDGSDELDGGDGADELWGGADNDEIVAGKGNDTIDGGTGQDVLEGGDGKDTFVFEEGDGHDSIAVVSNDTKDFDIEDDTLDFSAISGLGTDILAISSETKQGGEDGVLVKLGDNQSVFIAGIELGDIRDANIIWADS